MTDDEARDILRREYSDEDAPSLAAVLRAHAQLFRGGRTPEHAAYIDRAADRIEKLEAVLAGKPTA